MILNLLMADSEVPISEYSASISPPEFEVTTTNGLYATPFFEAKAQNGVGPFEYLWTIESQNAQNVTISSPNKARTNFTVSSYNIEVDITVKCEVTDTGNADEKAESTALIFIIFGNVL